MQLAKIIGYARSITKSDDLYGAELLIAVPVDMDTMNEAGKPFLVADKLGAKRGQIVVYAALTPYRQDDAVMMSVVAIPEALYINDTEHFRQIVEAQRDEEPVEIPMPTKSSTDTFEGFDPVSDLTAEFKALHQEIDRLSGEQEEPLSKTATNTVPYEDYAKYLTTELEPVESRDDIYRDGKDDQGYSRVGYRSDKNR